MMSALLKSQFVAGGFFPRTLSEHENQISLPNQDEQFMSDALLVAMNAIGWSSPNPSVGCVIVKENKIIASGFTQSYKFEHAEQMAFQELVQKGITDLSDAAAYVTLEPCAHQGNQPPCVNLFLNSNISRIVIGTKDPDVRVSGRSIDSLTRAGKKVITGILENECRAWHAPFLKTHSKQKIFWAAKWAETSNGYLAEANGNSKWITNVKSRAYTHWLRQKYDAIAVGAGTWLSDQPRLTVRDCAIPIRRDPLKLIFDPNGRVMNHLETLKSAGPTKIYIKSALLKNNLQLVHLPNVEWIPLNDSDSVASFIDQVATLSIQSVMVEGGPRFLDALFERNIFDVCHQFIAPKTFNNAQNQFKLSSFNKNAFFQLAEQKIDDDYLHEWSK